MRYEVERVRHPSSQTRRTTKVVYEADASDGKHEDRVRDCKRHALSNAIDEPGTLFRVVPKGEKEAVYEVRLVIRDRSPLVQVAR